MSSSYLSRICYFICLGKITCLFYVKRKYKENEKKEFLHMEHMDRLGTRTDNEFCGDVILEILMRNNFFYNGFERIVKKKASCLF